MASSPAGPGRRRWLCAALAIAAGRGWAAAPADLYALQPQLARHVIPALQAL